MERTALISNPAMVKEEYSACYDMLKMTNYTSLKEVEKKDPMIFEYYCECFANLVFVNMTSDKIKYQSEKVDDEGNTKIITSCSKDITQTLRDKGQYVFDLKNGIDDVFNTVSNELFAKDYEKDSFFAKTNDSNHAINKLSKSVYNLLVDLVEDCNSVESKVVSIHATVCTSDDGEELTYEDTIPDPRVNTEGDYINIETIKMIKEFARDNCLYFIKKKHPERMLGYILSLTKAYFKDDDNYGRTFDNEFMASMIRKHGYSYTLNYFCNMATSELNIDIRDITNLNIAFKKPASEVVKRDIELWKTRSISDAKERSREFKRSL